MQLLSAEKQASAFATFPRNVLAELDITHLSSQPVISTPWLQKAS